MESQTTENVPDVSTATVGRNFSHYWIYAVVPIAAALVAIGIAYILRSRGGSQSGIETAQESMEEFVAENADQPGESVQTR